MIAIVLDHRPAARRRHQDGVETVPLGLPEPDGDVGARARQRVAVASEVMGQRAAALLVLDQHDLDAVTRQEVDGGLVDARRQHLLGAALQQRDASAPFALGRENASAGRSRRRQAPGASASIALIRRNKVGVADTVLGAGSSAASGRPNRARIMLSAKQSGPRQHPGQNRPQQPARSAALHSPFRSSPAPDRPDACSSRPTDRWSCRRGRRDSGRCA